MDDQTSNISTGSNVLGAAPTTMGDTAVPLTGVSVTDSAPDASPAPVMPAYDPAPVVAPESTAPVAEDKSDDQVTAALKRIEDKLDSIALKVGA